MGPMLRDKDLTADPGKLGSRSETSKLNLGPSALVRLVHQQIYEIVEI